MNEFKSPMLASDYDPSRLVFPCIASAKIDGIRCVIDRTGESERGLFDPYSRSGKIIRNKYVQMQLGMRDLFGLDGELVVGDAAAPDVYNRTSSGIMSTDGEPDFTFWVFDMRHLGDVDYDERCEALGLVCSHVGHPRIKILEQRLIYGMEELELFEAVCLAQGFEGIMVRDPSKPYLYGRSKPQPHKPRAGDIRGGELLKVKRVSTDEGEIIGFEEQMANENPAFTDELGFTTRSSAKAGLVPADTLGAFICRNESKWPGQTFNISPGVLTHAERKEVWDNRMAYLGRLINFKHLAHGAKDKPRHGRLNGFRDPTDL